MNKIKIHFVCRGNVYRSRIAEIYVKSLGLTDVDVSSSGIEASWYAKDFIAPWTKYAAQQNQLDISLSPISHQTNEQTLANSDIIVFVNTDVYKDALKKYNFNTAKSLVWKIADRYAREKHHRSKTIQKPPTALQKRKVAINKLKREINKLLHDIKHGGWVDIVDSNNKPLSFKLPISIACDKGQWFRSCHAIITTPNKNILVQKRSKAIIIAPNLIDITLGGALAHNENSKQAVLRETQEELGIAVDPDNLKFLDTYKWNSYHPHYKKYSREFLDIYHVKINDNNPTIVLQRSEVAEVKSLNVKQVHRLVAMHRLKGLGRLNYAYVFYKHVLALTDI